ncbi:hypothetical protein JCM10212_004005, partial [Sporobolomyces blumeae]
LFDFLRRARPHFPPWWTEADKQATLAMSRSTALEANLYDAIEKDMFNAKWGSSTAAMGVRMWTDKFAEVKIGS